MQTALFSNLYQPQDTLNHIADYYGRAGELLDTPLGAYPAALARASLLREDTAAEWR